MCVSWIESISECSRESGRGRFRKSLWGGRRVLSRNERSGLDFDDFCFIVVLDNLWLHEFRYHVHILKILVLSFFLKRNRNRSFLLLRIVRGFRWCWRIVQYFTCVFQCVVLLFEKKRIMILPGSCNLSRYGLQKNEKLTFSASRKSISCFRHEWICLREREREERTDTRTYGTLILMDSVVLSWDRRNRGVIGIVIWSIDV